MNNTLERIIDTLSLHINIPKTVYFNFKVLGFKRGVHFPIFLYGHIKLEEIHRGCVELDKCFRMGGVKIGGGWYSEMFGHSSRFKSYLRIKGKLILGTNITIQQGVTLSISENAVVRLGNGVFFNENMTLHAKEKIEIGDKCWFGWNAQLLDSDFHYLINKGKLFYRNAPIIIDHNVWVANGVSITKGTRLPAYSVVASRSLINKDFTNHGEHCLIGGIPAKVITNNVERLIIKDSEVDKLFKNHEDVLYWEEIKEELEKEKYQKQ